MVDSGLEVLDVLRRVPYPIGQRQVAEFALPAPPAGCESRTAEQITELLIADRAVNRHGYRNLYRGDYRPLLLC